MTPRASSKKIPSSEVKEEITRRRKKLVKTKEEKETFAEEKKEKEKEKQTIEEGKEAFEKEKESFKFLSLNMETEDSEEEKLNDSGVGSEKEERQDLENNNLAKPIHLKGKKERKREPDKVSGEELKPRIKKKKVKRLSREGEEEELKPQEEKVVHRQKARLSVKDDVGWEERGWGEIKVIKHLGSGQVRLELRGTQYGEVSLSQLVTPEVLASFTRTGATTWGWRDPRMREQFKLTLDSHKKCDSFKIQAGIFSKLIPPEPFSIPQTSHGCQLSAGTSPSSLDPSNPRSSPPS